MLHLSNNGRRPKNEELAEILHEMGPGDVLKVIGQPREVMRMANSLSRTHKNHNKTRFMCRTQKDTTVVITCVKDRKPTTVIIV